MSAPRFRVPSVNVTLSLVGYHSDDEGSFTIEAAYKSAAIARLYFNWQPDDGQDEGTKHVNIPRVTFSYFDLYNALGLRDLDVLRAVLDAIVDSNADHSWSDAFETLVDGETLIIQVPIRKVVTL